MFSKSRFWVIVFAAGVAIEGVARPLTFESLPKAIRDQNTHYQGSALEAEGRALAVPSLAQPFYPQLTAQAGLEAHQTELQPRRTDPFWSVEAQVNLFSGGRDQLERASALAGAEAAGIEAKIAFLDELAKARKAYADLILQLRKAETLALAEELNRAQLGSAARRRSAGVATNTDALEFEVKAIHLAQDRMSVESEVKKLRDTLAILVGSEGQVDVEVGAAYSSNLFDPKSVPAVVPATLITQLEELKNDQVDLDRRRAARWWIPAVDLYGGYALKTMRESDEFLRNDRDEFFGGIRASVTLFDGGTSFRQAREKSLVARGTALKLRQTALEQAAELRAGLETIRRSLSLIENAKKAETYAQRYLNQTADEYRRGVKNSPDVSAATDKMIDAKSRRFELEHEYVHSLTDVLSLVGPDHPLNR